MNERTKEVDYFKYCKRCKHHGLEGYEDPCNECLTQGFNYDTRKPIKYEEAVR